MAKKLYRVELERKVIYKMIYLIDAESSDDAEMAAIKKDQEHPIDLGTVWYVDRNPKLPTEIK